MPPILFHYCCVCGLPNGIYHRDEFADNPWDYLRREEYINPGYDQEKLPASQLEWTRSDLVGINDISFTSENNPYRDKEVTSLQGERFTIKDACFDLYDQYLLDITEENSIFPIHTNCFSIIEHVARQKSRVVRESESITGWLAIEDFYRSLDARRQSILMYQETIDGIRGKGIDWVHGSNGARRLWEGKTIDKIRGKGIDWVHGYYGARRFWGENVGWTMVRGWEFLCADPFDIPDLTDYVLFNLRAMPFHPQTQARSFQSQPELEHQERSESKLALDSLPNELLDRICEYLPCTTILHLHRVNRALSTRISLDQSFWRNQLISGSLVPFIWDLDAVKCREKDGSRAPPCTPWDWRLLAYTLKKEPFVEVALRNSLPFYDEVAEDRCTDIYNGLWADLSKDAESLVDGSPPLGLINRVRIVRIIHEAMTVDDSALIRELVAKKPPPLTYDTRSGWYYSPEFLAIHKAAREARKLPHLTTPPDNIQTT